MTHKERVQAGKEIIKRMDLMEEDDKLTFRYKGSTYQLRCYLVYEDGKRSYAIVKTGAFGDSGMNIKRVGPTTLELYSYNMMNQKSTYKMDMSLMVIDIPVEV